MLGGQFALLKAAEDFEDLLLGLLLNVGGDVGASDLHSEGDGSEVIGKASYRDEVGDQVQGHDDIPEGTDDFGLDLDGYVFRLQHIVKHIHVEKEFASHLLAEAFYLVVEALVGIVASVGSGVNFLVHKNTFKR